jgi:hypothetical protein
MHESSDSESVIVISSEPGGEGGRVFTVIGPEAGETFLLPGDLATEADLVKAMEGRGYRLTMVGGGSRIDEIRRFYFRKTKGR